jgi:uncharacterized membrane protein
MPGTSVAAPAQPKETVMTNALNGARLAAMAAALAASSLAFAANAPAGATGKAVAANDMVHCYGVNACKGQNDCKTTQNACKGHGSCKGHGFKAMKAMQCLSEGGIIADLAASSSGQ